MATTPPSSQITSEQQQQVHWYQEWSVEYRSYTPITQAIAQRKGMQHFILALAAIPSAYVIVIGERESNFIAWVKAAVPDVTVSVDDKIAAEAVLRDLLKSVDGGDGVPYSAEAYSDKDRLCLIARATLNYRDV